MLNRDVQFLRQIFWEALKVFEVKLVDSSFIFGFTNLLMYSLPLKLHMCYGRNMFETLAVKYL